MSCKHKRKISLHANQSALTHVTRKPAWWCPTCGALKRATGLWQYPEIATPSVLASLHQGQTRNAIGQIISARSAEPALQLEEPED